MAVLTEDLARPGHYIISEANGYRSRDEITVASGAGVLKAGRVLGKVTASGKYVNYTPGASDGSQNAAAILYQGCDATSADVRRTITARDSEVQADVLNWGPAVTTDTHKNTALAALAALGIISR
ncbi:head decoration protein [Ancylobacter sp. SL191]|uniref:head decoration protein n=1 Tax=Ancylobacter sp. SL191 TaxID=2995166 RepID=UPI00226D8D7D|nr:head decoration protein [Ancylobacter sp. SL191]WAC26417.1 head decoration protein [Ancylobacter sp. SL191]